MQRASFLRRPIAILALLFALCPLLSALSAAATREYDAEAAPVVQIDSITFAGTWAAAETYSVVIGNATLTVTTGSDTVTLANVALTCANAINAGLIDQNKVGAEKRSAAGQLLGEFRDVEAVIDPADSTKVLIRSRVAGVPFYAVGSATLTVAETSASGTIAAASVQAANGPWHWSTAKNWSGDTLPANDDRVVFKETSAGPKYGLPTGTLEVTIEQHNSLTGTIGLPFQNANGYTEYRQRDVKLNDAGTGTAITHLFGLGDGPGSPLINVSHNYAGAGLVVSAVVYNTALPTIAGSKALNLVVRNETEAGSITVSKGSVNVGEQFGLQPRYATLNVSYRANAAADADVLTRNHDGAMTVNQSAGNVLFVETINPSGNRTFNLYGGTLTARDIQTNGTITATVSGGTLVWDSTKTIATAIVSGPGTFDAEKDGPGRSFTVTNCDLFRGGSWLDKFGRGSYTNGIDLNRCGVNDLTLRFGEHKRVTLGAVP